MVARVASVFSDDQDGTTIIEMSLVITLLLVVVLGFVDFGRALYQWNQASKAVQIGARLAAVSAPVPSDLHTLVDTLNSAVIPGEPSVTYTYSCNGATATCSDGAYSSANLNRIVLGADGNCGPPYANATVRRAMCDIFGPGLQPANVTVEYSYSGLGYASRPGGPVPTIQVRLQNLTFDFFFLGDLLGFGTLEIPAMTGTITGEDLCHTWPCI